MVMFGSKHNGTGAKAAAIATSQYYNIDHPVSFLKHNAVAKFLLLKPIHSKDIPDFVIYVHAVTTYDVIIL